MAVRRSELLIHTTVQVNVEIIVAGERRQAAKSMYCVKPLKMCIIQPNDTQKI